MKVLHTFEKSICVCLDPHEGEIAAKKLNLNYFNDEQCNKLVDDKLVAKYPEKETPEIRETYYAVRRSYEFTIKVNFMEDGTLQLA